MLKQNDVVNYTATGYSNAETVGVVQDTTLFVPQLIVGEQALVKVTYVKRGVGYGVVQKVLTPSPLRVTPACKHFGKCGGCALMHMHYAQQLAFKQNKVQLNLRKVGKLDVDVLPCVPSSKVVEYRNKLSLPVGGKVGNVKIGMYQKNTHNVVDADYCLLGGSWAQAVTKAFRTYANSQRIAPYDEKTFTGEVRHVVARYVQGQLLVVVVSNGEFNHDLQPFCQLLAKSFDKFGVYVNVNTYQNNVILGKQMNHVYGIKQIQATVGNVKLRLRPGSFYQVNDQVKDEVYAKVRQLLDVSRTQVLVDCFSGVGVLTNVLASPNYDTFAIEIEPSATSDANQMAMLNDAPRVTNVCGDVTEHLPKIVQQNKDKVLSLVVDPPRKGLGLQICQLLCDSNVDNLVYISCDSATLARDLSILATAYDVAYVQPFDMFPNTAEVETVAHLVKKRKNGVETEGVTPNA